MNAEVLERDAGRQRGARLRGRVLVAHVDVGDVHLEIFQHVSEQAFHERRLLGLADRLRRLCATNTYAQ